MTNDLKISLFDMVSCISSVVDMVNPLIVDHHKQVAYIALCIARELKLPLDQQQDLVLADSVAVSIDKQQEILSQSSGIYRKIEGNAGETFIPELVTVMKNIATKEYFWCDLESNKLGNIISKSVVLPTIEYDIDVFTAITEDRPYRKGMS